MLYVCSIVFLFIIRCRFPRNKSIAEVIRIRYGSHVPKLTRKYEKLDFKVRKTILDIQFLETCVTNEVIPKFLQFKLSNPRLRLTRTYKDSQKRFLLAEISLKRKWLDTLNIQLLKVNGELNNTLSFFDKTHVVNLSVTTNIKLITNLKGIQNYKLQELIGKEMKHDPKDVIRNYSSYELSESEKLLLVKGLNYAIPPKKLKYEDYLLPFELLYRDTRSVIKVHPTSTLSDLRSRVRDIGLSSLRVYNKKNHTLDNLTAEDLDAFVKLSSNKDIIIQKADKGNTVVLVDKLSYVEKMEEILGDTSKFQEVVFNSKHKVNKEVRHLLSMEHVIKSFLKELLENNYLSKEDYTFMLPVGSNPGILYGLCKVHKDEGNGISTPPFRPILSSIGTCSYKMAKFFVPVLKEYTTNDFTVNDSFSLAEEIMKQDASMYMTSFDVKSLFTNIPLDETIDICIEKLYNRKRKIKGLLKRQCKKLLTLATKSSFFVFNGNYYSQIDGVAMGSPLGPTLANIFLCHHETSWLSKCPVNFRPLYYRRYIDDVLVLFKSKDHVKKFLVYMNSRHGNITFTFEEELNNKLPFLDIEITRAEGKFITSIYRKETFSGVYLNFLSYLPKDYKRGLIDTLLYRAYKISSSFISLHVEIENLKVIWRKNTFPLYFIDKCILKFLNKLFVQKSEEKTTSQKKELLVVLPFLGNISIQLRKRLRSIYRECLPNIKLNVIFNSKNRLRNSFSFKDVIPRELKSLVVYKYKCSICNDTDYVGKTKRHFITRGYEHLGLSVLTDKSFTYNSNTATAVRKHISECTHASSLNDIQIVSYARNDYHLKIKESLLISKLKPSLNTSEDSIPLYLFN